MKKRVIKGITYEAKATKENGKFYPVVNFYGSALNENYYLDNPQPTRSKALTVASVYIKNMQD